MNKLIDKMKQFEIDFAKFFSNYIIKPYGIIFYNLDNKLYYDGNHAFIFDNNNIDESIKDIIHTYHTLGITPRIYSTLIGELVQIQDKLVEYSFTLCKDQMTYMVHNKQDIKITNQRLEFKRILDFDDFLIDHLLDEEEKLYKINALQTAIKNKDYYLFVGYLENIPVTMASLAYSQELKLSRIDDVKTVENYRRKGYASELIKYIVNFHNQYLDSTLYLYSDNNEAIRIYQEAGFYPLELTYEIWSAHKEK